MKKKYKISVKLLSPAAGNIVRTIKSNYFKMNWQNMVDPRWNFRTPGILEIWESEE